MQGMGEDGSCRMGRGRGVVWRALCRSWAQHTRVRDRARARARVRAEVEVRGLVLEALPSDREGGVNPILAIALTLTFTLTLTR